MRLWGHPTLNRELVQCQTTRASARPCDRPVAPFFSLESLVGPSRSLARSLEAASGLSLHEVFRRSLRQSSAGTHAAARVVRYAAPSAPSSSQPRAPRLRGAVIHASRFRRVTRPAAPRVERCARQRVALAWRHQTWSWRFCPGALVCRSPCVENPVAQHADRGARLARSAQRGGSRPWFWQPLLSQPPCFRPAWAGPASRSPARRSPKSRRPRSRVSGEPNP